jgi:tetratricopeptide (TPR) repeat protein
MLYTERVFAEHRLADFVGAFADTDHDVKLQPDNPDFLLGRALATLWLGRFAAAQADVSAAADIARRTGKSEVEAEAAKTLRRIDRWRAHGKPDQCKFQNIGDQTGAQAIIADCTAAFLTAGSPARKAEMLTVRSTAWAVDGDRSSQADDLQVAAALDPGNWERHSNLGFVYVDGHHSAAGLEEFDKAIALGSGSFVTYAGRAGANYNLGNMKEAFADAKKSVEIRPNEVALIILGDLASSVEKDDKQAKYYWLAAYRLGSRDDRLKERLHSVGVDHPESEPATK